ncbi:required for meiotic nuclear division protein 1 homolog isoform X2 [Danaus plexippus]|uniref:required for meiotic nuclear division protein 1 homolog isoform X2 n=1 Tax=Danaus plexippus TaxID=13037 RepID=UPI002AB019D4|nr:required for meiotic nuclear division protein 1 homolog isoform X2 [Danaus plexippus]
MSVLITKIFTSSLRQQVSRSYSNDTILPTSMALDNTSLPLKKKTVHKKTLLEDVSHKEGHYLTLAYATANNYDLKALREGLVNQKLYEPETLKSQDLGDVVVAHAVYSIGHEPREIIFFREGAVVFWNCTELEANNVLDFVRPFEMGSYPNEVVNKEREVMTYDLKISCSFPLWFVSWVSFSLSVTSCAWSQTCWIHWTSTGKRKGSSASTHTQSHTSPYQDVHGC